MILIAAIYTSLLYPYFALLVFTFSLLYVQRLTFSIVNQRYAAVGHRCL